MATIKDFVRNIFKKINPTDDTPDQSQKQTWAENVNTMGSDSQTAQKKGWTDSTTSIIPILSPYQMTYSSALNSMATSDALNYVRYHSGKSEHKVYEEMMLDPHIDSAYVQRQSAVLKDGYSIVGDNVPIKIRTMVHDVLEMCDNFDDALKLLDKASMTGCRFAEINWEKRNKNIIAAQINDKHNLWFDFAIDGALKYTTIANYPMYDLVPQEMSRKFLVHTWDMEAGDRRGKPTLLKLYNTWYFKKHLTIQWGVFISRYADPAWIAQCDNMFAPVPGDVKGRTIAEFLSEFLAEVRQKENVVIPNASNLKLTPVEPGNVIGSHALFVEFMKELKDIITICIVGQTLTTSTSGVGSYAMADVHYQVRADIAELGKLSLESVINKTLVPWICDYNGYPGLEVYPEFLFNREKALNTIDLRRLQSMGVKFRMRWLAETCKAAGGLPEGMPDDEIAISEIGGNPFGEAGAEE